MPELPEIEHLKRTLEPCILGARLVDADLARHDVLRNGNGAGRRGLKAALLAGQRVAGLARHGKQLAIIGSGGSVLCVHLGMSGQLRFLPNGERPAATNHIHCTWRVDSPGGNGRLIFRDPRRFGGLWHFDSLDQLQQERWRRLGPDALTIRAPILRMRLHGRGRPIKAALLDQAIIAGVGNIYADEALFAAAIAPTTPAGSIDNVLARRLACSIRTVLRRAVRAGGSTLRDYVDGSGEPGWFAVQHKVYGRGGMPCVKCKSPLHAMSLGQRTTVYCLRCQAMPAEIHNAGGVHDRPG